MSRILASTPAVLKDATLAPWLRDLLLWLINNIQGDTSIDGGSAASSYLSAQSIDGGSASG